MPNSILYIDGFNLFQANYHANSAQDTNGEPIGGFIGTLIQIRNLIYKFSPHKVFVVFDGPDAGLRRRILHKEYKSKRKAKKRATSVSFGDDKERIDVNNETEQLEKLFAALRILPLQVISIPFYEADDVIAYMVLRTPLNRSIIVSNDKDYLQLVNEKVSVYQFSKKRLMGLQKIEEEFGINPYNIIYFRSIIGDTSDELSGVKGIGPDTVKKISAFKERKFDSFMDFWSEIDKLEDTKSKKLKLLKESQKQALLMYQLMRLDETSINQRAIDLLKVQIEQQLNKNFSSVAFRTFCIKNKLNLQLKNIDDWLSTFFRLKCKITYEI